MKIKHIFHGWNLEQEEKFLKTPVGIFLFGAFLGELSPDPTDAIHFWLENHVLNNSMLHPGARAAIEIFDWYFMSACYFLVLLILAYVLHVRRVSIVKRLTIIGGLVSVGIVIGILAKLFLGA